MPERQRHAKIANEMADRLQRSAEVPRWNKSERQTIEEWAKDHEMTFAQAIRRLVELGLTVKTKAKQPSAARAVRAKELAAKAIEKIIDPAAPPEERAQRRRHLTKGPSEFREDRVDLPRANRK
jgi:hypothetical protein